MTLKFNRSFFSDQTCSARTIYHVTRPAQAISKERAQRSR